MANNIIGDAFAYAKEGLLGNFTKWILVIVLALIQGITLCIIPVLNGYIVRIYSGEKTLPEVDHWGKLFVDGWKYNIIAILYMIPAIIVAVVLGFFTILSVSEMTTIISGGNAAGVIELVTGIITVLFILLIVLMILSLFLMMGLVRLGKTGRIGEAFSFGAINKQISSGVGWLGYIGYVILLWILGLILMLIIAAINILLLPLGILVMLLILPAWSVFAAKYMTNIYDAGESA